MTNQPARIKTIITCKGFHEIRYQYSIMPNKYEKTFQSDLLRRAFKSHCREVTTNAKGIDLLS